MTRSVCSVGEGADRDAAGRRGGLEARGRVHGVAGKEALARAGGDVEPHEGFAGVDATACPQRGAVGARHALERREGAQGLP